MTVADGYTPATSPDAGSVRDTSYRPEVLQSDNMEVRMYGHTAVVTGSYLEKGKDKGKPFERGALYGYLDQSKRAVRCVASHFSVQTVADTIAYLLGGAAG